MEEAEVRLGLRQEFEEYHGSLVGRIEQHGRMLAAMGVILEFAESGEWTSQELTIDDALALTVHPPTSDFGNGVRDALVQAARLEIISDPILRRRLAEWPRYFEELLDDEVFGRRIVMEEILPYLTSKGLPLSVTTTASMAVPGP